MFSSDGGTARRIAQFSSSNGMHGLLHWSALWGYHYGALHGANIACVMNDGIKNIILLALYTILYICCVYSILCLTFVYPQAALLLLHRRMLTSV